MNLIIPSLHRAPVHPRQSQLERYITGSNQENSENRYLLSNIIKGRTSI